MLRRMHRKMSIGYGEAAARLETTIESDCPKSFSLAKTTKYFGA
jgi:hypothetical protein